MEHIIEVEVVTLAEDISHPDHHDHHDHHQGW